MQELRTVRLWLISDRFNPAPQTTWSSRRLITVGTRTPASLCPSRLGESTHCQMPQRELEREAILCNLRDAPVRRETGFLCCRRSRKAERGGNMRFWQKVAFTRGHYVLFTKMVCHCLRGICSFSVELPLLNPFFTMGNLVFLTRINKILLFLFNLMLSGLTQ
jgi:hypothetical protein